MKYTIEDLRNGKCAVINNGTKDQIKEVLKLAFNETNVLGNHSVYYKGYDGKCESRSSGLIPLPSQSVIDFLNPYFKWGEDVKAFDQNWIYIAEDPINKGTSVIMNIEGRFAQIATYRLEKIPEVLELTMEEIAVKFGKPVDQIRVKK